MTADESAGFDRRTLLKTLGASATAGGLAGCSNLTTRRYGAVPVVLSTEATDAFGYEDVDHERLVDERSGSAGPVEGTVVVTSTVFTYATGESRELSTEWPRSESPPVGVVSTPRVEEGGQELNPMATESLDDIVAGPRGRELLARVGVLENSDVRWQVPPEAVASADARLFEETVTIERYVGVVDEDDGPGRAVRVDAVKGSREDDEVIAAAGEQRSLTADESDGLGGTDCETLNCLDEKLTFEERTSVFEQITANLVPCPVSVEQAKRSDVDLDECVKTSGGGDPMEFYHLDLSGVRVVQTVEDTRVAGDGYTEPDPPLVDGENAAIVFDLAKTSGSLQTKDWDTDVSVDIERRFSGGRTESDTFTIPNRRAKDMLDGNDPRAVFHQMAATSSDPDPVTFPADVDLESIRVSITVPDDDDLEWSAIGDDVTLREGRNADFVVDEVRPVRIGFVELQDDDNGSNYGHSSGRVDRYRQTVYSSIAFIHRVFPGPLVTYRHTNDPIEGKQYSGNPFVPNPERKHYQEAKSRLDDVVNNSSLSSSGQVRTFGVSDSEGKRLLKKHGFDVTVLVVPGDVSSNSGGTHYYDFFYDDGASIRGLAPQTTDQAVSVLESGDKNVTQEGAASTAAQEGTHRLQNNPYFRPKPNHEMAQRRTNDKGNSEKNLGGGLWADYDHARHQGSTVQRSGNRDGPGVVSTGFDLTDGSFTAISGHDISGLVFSADPHPSNSSGNLQVDELASFMSYTGRDTRGEAWTDSRVHRHLVDGLASGGSGGGADRGGSEAMLAAAGAVTDDGSVQFGDVLAYDGFPGSTDTDDGTVVVEFVDPHGETLVRRRVPDRQSGTHVETVEGMVTFSIRFPVETASVRTARDGVTTRMNPIERSVRDAVARVPDDGFRETPREHRAAVNDALDRVAKQMLEDEYDAALETMDEDVRSAVESGVNREYDDALNQPSLSRLLGLVDEMVERLTVLVEAAG